MHQLIKKVTKKKPDGIVPKKSICETCKHGTRVAMYGNKRWHCKKMGRTIVDTVELMSISDGFCIAED